MKFTIYDSTTGQIISVRDCPDITQQALNPLHSYIEGDYSGTEYYIDDGVPVTFPSHNYTYPLFDYETKTWSEDIRRITNDVLTKRRNFLVNTDWTQLPNNPLSTEKQTAWAVYRQELRDITNQSGYPLNVTWPTKPN
jgi:hypothetical protein